ncbi:MAG: hypothetical protein AAB479_01135 [Patescibacteria group bacterium]
MEAIFYNIVGGIIVAALIEAWIRIGNFLSGKKFRNIFGFNLQDPFYISYGVLQLGAHRILNDKGEQVEYPFNKPGRREVFGKIPYLVSDAQTRGVSYLATSFGKNSNVKPYLVSDIEIAQKLDVSYCSVGGRNNLKTNSIEEHEENEFFKFNISAPGSIVGVKDSSLKFTVKEGYDYGFIIKIQPKSLQNRTWVGIAGLGVWGTSGAAWFLARNWKSIEKIYGTRPFGLIVKVRIGKDESAQMVYNSP